MPHRRHAPPHRTTPPIEAMRTIIAARAPRAEAAEQITITAPHARSAYLQYSRLAGPRDHVLDYVAYLFATDTGKGHARWDLDAVEKDADGELSLLLSRSAYAGPEPATE